MAQYITMRPIFELAVEEESHPGSPATMFWWEQDVIWFRNEGGSTDKSEVERG